MDRYAEEKIRVRVNGTPRNDEFDLIIGVSSIVDDLAFVTDNIKEFQHRQSHYNQYLCLK